MVEYGTRVVQKRDGGSVYPVYGGGGATFRLDTYNREDRLVIGRFAMSERCTRFVTGQFFLNDSGLTVSPRDGRLLPRFLDYQMLSLNDALYALGKGSAQRNLDVPAFRVLPVFVPDDLEVQRRIVGILDEAFEGIATARANAEKNLRNARAVFESYLASLFAQRGEGWLPRVSLSTVLATQPRNGWSPPKVYQTGVGTPVLTLSSVTGFEYDGTRVKMTTAPTKQDAHYWLRDGELLVTRSNTRSLVGHVAIYDGTPAKAICCDLIMKMTVNPAKALTRFVYYYLRSPVARSYLMGQAHGANPTMVKIGKRVVQDIQLPAPPISEQQAVVTVLDNLLAETRHLESVYQRKLVALDTLKQSLLHHAFSGQL